MKKTRKGGPITFDAVRRMGLALPRTEAATGYGSPALKVDGRMFACMAIHKSAEPNSLVLRVDFPERDELIAADPATYYLTSHYVEYQSVLVRLDRVHPDALEDLLLMAHRFVAAKAARRPRTRRARPGRR